MFNYFDIHSHLHFDDYEDDREDQIKLMKRENIGTISIGSDLDSSKEALELAEKHQNIFATVGIHPTDAGDRKIFDVSFLDLAKKDKIVGIGECGLEYFQIDESKKEIKNNQKNIFEAHIDLSLNVGKPLMLHMRPSKNSFDAYFDGLEILENYAKTYGEKLRGNAHFFAGNMDVLKRFLNIGFTVSFTGVITFTNDYDDLIRYTPLDMIMAETDAPFVAPVPYRGKRNSPLYITEVYKAISSIRNEPFEFIKNSINDNVIRNFGFKK